MWKSLFLHSYLLIIVLFSIWQLWTYFSSTLYNIYIIYNRCIYNIYILYVIYMLSCVYIIDNICSYSEHEQCHPFKYSLLFTHFLKFIFIERGRGEREREKHPSVASHTAPTGDWARNQGMCTAWESNWWPFR